MKQIFNRKIWLMPILAFLFLSVTTQAQITSPSPNTGDKGVSVSVSIKVPHAGVSSLTNATQYDLVVWSDPTGLPAIVETVTFTFDGTNGNTVSLTSNLSYNTLYAWAVYVNAGTPNYGVNELYGTPFTFTTQFSLTTPGNGLTGVSIRPNFTWSATAANYSLQVSKNSDMSSPDFTVSAITTNSHNVTETNKLTNNQVYYWQVTDANSNTSEIYQFKTTPSVSVSLVSPADNATGVGASYTTFTWYTGSLSSGMKYYLQYDEGSTTFTTADFSVVSSNLYYTKTSLLENTDYAWRVIAFIDDGDGNFETNQDVIVSYSTVFTFKTSGGSSVNAVPSFPTGGAKVYTNTPTLYWYLDSYGTNLTYDVQVNTSQSSSGATNYTNITSLYKTTGTLTAGTLYYWRVRVVYDRSGVNQVGSYSAWASFETNGTGTLIVPTPAYPASGVTVYTTSPTLYWSANGLSTGLVYDIELILSTASFTGSPTSGTAYNNVSQLYSQVSSLTPGASYKWKVRSDNGTGTSSWSSEATFTVAGGLSGGHAVPSYPTSNPTVYTNQPTLFWYVEGSTLGLDGFKVKYKKSSTEPTWSSVTNTSPNATDGVYSISSINTLSKQITVSLDYGAKYYWAVAAVDGSTEGTYSSGSFTVVGGSTVQPVLTSPISGNTVTTKSPTLYWSLYGNSAGVTKYYIHYSKTGFLSDSVTTNTTGTETYLTLSGLTAGATYTWWVRGFYSGSNYTAWSNKETFVVDPGASPVQPWIGGPNNVTIPTTSPVVSWVLPVQSESQLVYELEVADNPEFINSRIITSDVPFTQVDGLNLGKDYYWRARSKTVNTGQYSDFSSAAHFSVDQTTAVNETEVIPKEFKVSQNYPNPFNPSTVIEFALPSKEYVTVKIYDILGREITTLLNNEMPAGVHKLAWNGINNNGAEVSAGAYIYRITAGKNIVTKKMLLIK